MLLLLLLMLLADVVVSCGAPSGMSCYAQADPTLSLVLQPAKIADV